MNLKESRKRGKGTKQLGKIETKRKVIDIQLTPFITTSNVNNLITSVEGQGLFS